MKYVSCSLPLYNYISCICISGFTTWFHFRTQLNSLIVPCSFYFPLVAFHSQLVCGSSQEEEATSKSTQKQQLLSPLGSMCMPPSRLADWQHQLSKRRKQKKSRKFVTCRVQLPSKWDRNKQQLAPKKAPHMRLSNAHSGRLVARLTGAMCCAMCAFKWKLCEAVRDLSWAEELPVHSHLNKWRFLAATRWVSYIITNTRQKIQTYSYNPPTERDSYSHSHSQVAGIVYEHK